MIDSVEGTSAAVARRLYSSPTLVIHGTLVELTHVKGGGKSAGAPYGNAYGNVGKFPPKS